MSDFDNAPEQEFSAGGQQVDYFGIPSKQRHIFPDGISYVEFQPMNEGAKAKFQKATSRDLIIERQSGNARTSVDPATERHELLLASIVDWNLKRGQNTINFSDRALRDFLQLGDPKIIEDIEKSIRKANPWLLNDLSVEDIDKEIENLKELRVEAEKAAAEKDSSSSK